MPKKRTKKVTNKAQDTAINAELVTKAQDTRHGKWLSVTGADFDYSNSREPLTLKEIQRRYGPVKTMGLPVNNADDVYMAMDASLSDVGFYTQIQHAFALGQPPTGNGFVGYPALSELKQNGLISACVETVVDDMMREWIEIEYEEAKAI